MLALALVVVIAPSFAAAAPTVSERIAAAERARDDLEYEAARSELLEVIADPAASDDELLRAHLIAGEIARIMERDVDARMHFLYVLSRRPDMTLSDDTPPKIRTFFELVRQEVRDRDAARAPTPPPAAVETAPPDEGAHDAPLVDDAPLSDERTVFSWLGVAGGVVVVLSGLALGGALATASAAELAYANTSLALDVREDAQRFAVVSWGGAALLIVPVAVGLGLVALDVVRE